MGGRINTVMQTCFFAISGVLPTQQAIEAIKNSVRKTYAKKGDEIVEMEWKGGRPNGCGLPVQRYRDAVVPIAPGGNGELEACIRVCAQCAGRNHRRRPISAGSALPNDGTYRNHWHNAI